MEVISPILGICGKQLPQPQPCALTQPQPTTMMKQRRTNPTAATTAAAAATTTATAGKAPTVTTHPTNTPLTAVSTQRTMRMNEKDQADW